MLVDGAPYQQEPVQRHSDPLPTMNGPSEFTVTGTLKTWHIMDRLGEIEVPTLLVGGRYQYGRRCAGLKAGGEGGWT
jgi:hypothetical protein